MKKKSLTILLLILTVIQISILGLFIYFNLSTEITVDYFDSKILILTKNGDYTIQFGEGFKINDDFYVDYWPNLPPE